MILLDHGDSLMRNQRRLDFRIEENRTVSLWITDQFLGKAVDPFRLLKRRPPEIALLEDLSCGGASIIFTRELPVHKNVFINLDPLSCYDLPIVKGLIIRTERRGGQNKWVSSVRFESLDSPCKRKLIRYIFMKERNLIKAS